MKCGHIFREHRGQRAAHFRAKVTALYVKLFVAQLKHQVSHDDCNSGHSQAGFLRGLGPTETGQTRCNHLENSILQNRIRFYEFGDNVKEISHRAWPSVQHEYWNHVLIRMGRLGVDKVDFKAKQ